MTYLPNLSNKKIYPLTIALSCSVSRCLFHHYRHLYLPNIRADNRLVNAAKGEGFWVITPKSGGPCGIRTRNQLIKSQLLYH
jgi:hypothetical protein